MRKGFLKVNLCDIIAHVCEFPSFSFKKSRGIIFSNRLAGYISYPTRHRNSSFQIYNIRSPRCMLRAFFVRTVFHTIRYVKFLQRKRIFLSIPSLHYSSLCYLFTTSGWLITIPFLLREGDRCPTDEGMSVGDFYRWPYEWLWYKVILKPFKREAKHSWKEVRTGAKRNEEKALEDEKGEEAIHENLQTRRDCMRGCEESETWERVRNTSHHSILEGCNEIVIL